jgi:hypothetical protein
MIRIHDTSAPPIDPAGFDVSYREVTSSVAIIRVQSAKHMLVCLLWLGFAYLIGHYSLQHLQGW